MNIGIDLKDASTYAGTVAAAAGISEVVLALVPEPYTHTVQLVIGAVTGLAGLVFMLTKNYADTPNKVDDFLHGASSVLKK